MKNKVNCTCGWSWNKSDSSKKDMYICHECGRDNSNNMQNGGWLDSYADGGTMQEPQENYNDSYTYAPEGMIGDGFSNVGRNYSPAWGGSFQMGGNIYPVNYVPQAQDGLQTVNSRQKRGLDLLIKETELAKKDRQELNTTGQIKYPKSIKYKKLTPKQQPIVSQDKMSLVDRQKANDAMEQVNKEQLGLLERPLIYLNNPDKALGDIGIPRMDTSEEDRQKIMLNRYNPFQSNQDRLLNTIKMGIDYVPKAVVNTALASAFIPESSGVLGLLNETLNPIAGSGNNLIRIKSAANRFINNRLTIPSAINDAVRISDDAVVGTVKDKSKELISDIDWATWNSEIPTNKDLMNEYMTIEQTSKANNTWMKNPDGSAFQGTPEQFVQQNSENFKKAFPQGSNISYRGDLSNLSEIKSQQELGKEALKRKYNLTDQDTEALEKLWERSKDKLNSGKYTTNDYDAALNYAKGDKNKVLNLYTDIRNPKFTETGESFRVLEKDRQKLLSEGYDALITKPSSFYPEGENVLLKNNQIKSAIGNNGMFDMTNPNIYKAIVPGAIGLGAASQMVEEDPIPGMKQGGIIKDDNGYWNPDNWNSPVEIGSNEITMQDVPFDVLGISDEGDVKYMKANNPKNYKYKGKKVTEFRMAQNGLRQEQKGLVNLDQLTNFTNYNTKQPGGWLESYK